jgi:hypothetical protein
MVSDENHSAVAVDVQTGREKAQNQIHNRKDQN